MKCTELEIGVTGTNVVAGRQESLDDHRGRHCIENAIMLRDAILYGGRRPLRERQETTSSFIGTSALISTQDMQ